MYTQCPECDTAFRVTAEVLKQAAGMVRCGGCGNAFNALEYLTETKPAEKSPPKPEPELPELTPEPIDDDSGGELPKSISAEQSAALLKTLDQLAGSDIRIEDTGVEWRVMDEPQDPDEVTEVFDEPGETEVDELLEAAPTPVDQFLTATPDQIDAGEIFEEPEEPDEVRTTVDELRFDDHTPLPEDFDFDEVAPVEEVVEEADETMDSADAEDAPEPAAQVDLEFEEEDAWESLLDEVEDEIAELEEQAEEAAEPEDEQQAEDDAEPEVEEPEATEPEQAPASDQPPDMDTQFAIQAEAMGIDLSGIHETGQQLSDTEMTHDLDLDALLDDGPGEDTRVQELLQTQSLDEEVPAGEDVEEPEELEEAPVETDEAEEPVPEAEADADAEADEEESEELVESLELDLAEAEAAIEASTSGEYETLNIDDIDEVEDSDEVGEVDDIESAEEELEAEEDAFELPPMTEEEQTINMQIDQDLLAIAVEDEDGFASTIVKGSIEDILEEEQQAEEAEQKKKKKKEKKEKKKARAAESIPGTVETIIMEGESIRNALDPDRLADEDEDEILAGIRADTREQNKKGIRGGRRRTDPPSWGKIAALVALTIVLVGQVVHQSRETLATNELFVNTFGPIYRLIGRPLTPAWDIAGWRIEKSKGNFDENGQTLTIETQIRNKSGGNLPYPLIGVALTDRFEETIGHKMLEPNEYLGNGLDPRKAVVPDNTFIASMTIDAPSANATGFNLKVCYRLESGQLRCAIGDFK